jgi:hypothetical protein
MTTEHGLEFEDQSKDIALPVEALLKQARGKLNASNYLGMHDDIITAIDDFLEGTK